MTLLSVDAEKAGGLGGLQLARQDRGGRVEVADLRSFSSLPSCLVGEAERLGPRLTLCGH